ncbi:S8 family serine peptidase [bacterium]|nr:S8 family serine peptidase [bacterium]
MKINFLSTFLLCLCFQAAFAQTSWVYLTDKCAEDTINFFDQSVCESYTQSLKQDGYEIVGSSRWLNAVCIANPDPNLYQYNFVAHVELMRRYKTRAAAINEDFAYGTTDWAHKMIGLDSFHRMGYTGKKIKIAVFDAGFYGVDTIEYFDSIRMNDLIMNNYDFHRKSSLDYKQSKHGMQVLALMAANYPDSMVGASPHARYALARTEISGEERHIEELAWINAMEWADSMNMHIIHSSLGYSVFDSLEGDYTYADMDGNSTIITLAAEHAFEENIFVTNSAGNQGDKEWKYITAPCDGKNVLCIGAVDSSGTIAPFSSRGPSSDGRVKPEVVGMGVNNTVPASNGVLQTGSGTSFSGPIIAGMVACLMEAHPDASNKEIFHAVIRSADRYFTPDSAYGYGIPNVLKAHQILNKTAHVEEPAEMKVKVYPNPGADFFKVICDPGTSYTVTSSDGRTIASGTFKNWINFLEAEDWSNGLYHISLNNGAQTQTITLIKS